MASLSNSYPAILRDDDVIPLDAPSRQAWATRLRHEAEHHVLPWWQREIFGTDGRVLGGRSNDGTLLDLPRSAVLGARLLWTFASAQVRLTPEPAGARAAQRAWLAASAPRWSSPTAWLRWPMPIALS